MDDSSSQCPWSFSHIYRVVYFGYLHKMQNNIKNRIYHMQTEISSVFKWELFIDSWNIVVHPYIRIDTRNCRISIQNIE